ncbi:MAG: phage antirepressor protein [Oscillospiraceae bacterium]|nr:phage antirepressor protein [Oscillospiraceae bacterium]
MDENKLQVISKFFNNDSIRTIWDKESEKYYISVTDVVGVLSESKDGKTYWRVLKHRLKKEGNESVTDCNELKLKASDGKYYKTDVCDIEGMFRIIQSIPSKNAEPFKQWLAKLGSERIDETFDPSLALQRAIDLYRAKGYDEAWIAKRIKALQDRKQLTDVWKVGGIQEGLEYAILTNEIYKTWSGMTAKQYKQFKGLRKESLRDNMDNIELILTDLSEEATKMIAQEKNPKGLKENIKTAKDGGNVAKIAKEDLEKKIGKKVVSSDNKLNYQYIDENNKNLIVRFTNHQY